MRAFTSGVGRTVVLRMLGIGGERQKWEVGTGWGEVMGGTGEPAPSVLVGASTRASVSKLSMHFSSLSP